eukprot:scaffold323_cov232-Pinguiococcus_pyrenoidosus.AAC.5
MICDGDYSGGPSSTNKEPRPQQVALSIERLVMGLRGMTWSDKPPDDDADQDTAEGETSSDMSLE